jgi:hypothetical protein
MLSVRILTRSFRARPDWQVLQVAALWADRQSSGSCGVGKSLSISSIR